MLLVALAVYILYRLRQPISWIVLATFLAIAMSGPVNLLERHMRRGFAIAIAYLILLLVPVGIAAIVVPPWCAAPTTSSTTCPATSPTSRTGSHEPQATEVRQGLQHHGQAPEGGGQAAVQGRHGRQHPRRHRRRARELDLQAVTIFILSIFMVGGARRWRARVLATIPDDRRDRVERLMKNIANAIGSFIAGALARPDRRHRDLHRPEDPRRALRGAACRADRLLRPDPAGRRHHRGDRRGRGNGLQRLPDCDDHLGDLGRGLPAGRRRDPAPDPVPRP